MPGYPGEAGDEADATGIMLEAGIIEAARGCRAGTIRFHDVDPSRTVDAKSPAATHAARQATSIGQGRRPSGTGISGTEIGGSIPRRPTRWPSWPWRDRKRERPQPAL